MKIAVTDYSSPLFNLALATSGDYLIRLSINSNTESLKNELSQTHKDAEFVESSKTLLSCMRWLDRYFAQKSGSLPRFKLYGTDFQKRVWQVLSAVPFGKLVTYGELAEMAGCRSARPIGGAMGRNPLPVVVPCHRVIAADMKLGGFSCGTEFKLKLLEHEGYVLDKKRQVLVKV